MSMPDGKQKAKRSSEKLRTPHTSQAVLGCVQTASALSGHRIQGSRVHIGAGIHVRKPESRPVLLPWGLLSSEESTARKSFSPITMTSVNAHTSTYLLKGPWSDDQPVRYVRGDADERRRPHAVAQDGAPRGVVVLEKAQLRRARQKAADDELKQQRQET